jgi:hypothetical protein
MPTASHQLLAGRGRRRRAARLRGRCVGPGPGALALGPWPWGPGPGALALGPWPWGPGPGPGAGCARVLQPGQPRAEGMQQCVFAGQPHRLPRLTKLLAEVGGQPGDAEVVANAKGAVREHQGPEDLAADEAEGEQHRTTQSVADGQCSCSVQPVGADSAAARSALLRPAPGEGEQALRAAGPRSGGALLAGRVGIALLTAPRGALQGGTSGSSQRAVGPCTVQPRKQRAWPLPGCGLPG